MQTEYIIEDLCSESHTHTPYTCTHYVQLEGQYEVVLQMFQLLYEPDVFNHIWGVIGPDDSPGVANFIARISANFGLLTVSTIIHTMFGDMMLESDIWIKIYPKACV